MESELLVKNRRLLTICVRSRNITASLHDTKECSEKPENLGSKTMFKLGSISCVLPITIAHG